MGDLASGFRGGRPRGWLSACILGMMMFMMAVRFVDAEASYSNYAPNVCYCDLNNHLQNVRSALLTGKDPSEIPSDDSTAVTDSPNSSGTSGTSGGNSNIDSSSSAGSNTDSSTASDTSSNSGTNTDTNTQSDSSDSGSTSSSSGSNASGGSSGTTASGDSSGTTASGDSSGTTASGDSSGTTASGDSSGTADSGDSSGTTASSNSSGTTASGDSSGTTVPGDSSGTTVSGNSSGTTVSGDSSGTTVSGDSSGTKASNDSSGTTVSGDSSGTTASVDSSGTTASNDSSGTTDSGSTKPGGSGGGNGNGNGNKKDSTTEAGDNATTTTAKPNSRRKRDVDEDDYYGKEAETLMETPLEEVLESYYGPRVKREAAPGAPLVDQKNPLFSFITQKVEFEGIKFSSDYGVEYDEEGNIKNCTCETGSSVELSICLLNLKYTSDLKDKTSEEYQLVSNRLLFPMSVILNKGLIAAGGVNLFRRLDIKAFRKEKDYTTAVLQVHLREKLYQAEYHVKNAIEPSIRHGEIGPYTTDHEECLVTVDQTPVEPEELPALWYLRFLCLPIAILVLVAIVVVICVGKRDACNVLKW